MTSSSSLMIEVSAEDFLSSKDNAALVKLLKVVRDTPDPEDRSTKKLCWKAFNLQSRGLHLIERAERLGLIERTGHKMPGGRGKARVVNLTKRGKLLLEKLNNVNIE